MKHWRTRILLLVVTIALPLEVLLLIALWPYLPIMGQAAAGFFVTCCICGSIYVVAWTWQRIHRPHIIVERDVVVMLMRDGSYHHLSAEQARATRLLPMPLEEEHQDLSAVDQMVIDRSKVLTLHFEEHMGMHAIADELKIPYNRVRDWVNIAEALRDQEKRSW